MALFRESNPKCLDVWESLKFEKPAKTSQNQIQCPLDIATGLRQGGWSRYRQRGRYIKDIQLWNGKLLQIEYWL